jgi:hypothetical protein
MGTLKKLVENVRRRISSIGAAIYPKYNKTQKQHHEPKDEPKDEPKPEPKRPKRPKQRPTHEPTYDLPEAKDTVWTQKEIDDAQKKIQELTRNVPRFHPYNLAAPPTPEWVGKQPHDPVKKPENVPQKASPVKTKKNLMVLMDWLRGRKTGGRRSRRRRR